MGVGDLRNLRGCGSVGCNFIAWLLDISYTVLGVILDLGCYSIGGSCAPVLELEFRNCF